MRSNVKQTQLSAHSKNDIYLLSLQIYACYGFVCFFHYEDSDFEKLRSFKLPNNKIFQLSNKYVIAF